MALNAKKYRRKAREKQLAHKTGLAFLGTRQERGDIKFEQ